MAKYDSGGGIFYFPTVAAPITVSFNLSGVDKLQLDADTLAGIFSRKITKWNDAAIAATNHGVDLPDTDDRRRAPRRCVGHDEQLHQVPHDRGAHGVDARQR